MEREKVKRIALALMCAMIPGTALAQQAYFPPPIQAAPAPPKPDAVGSVSDDAQPAPDPYASSQEKLFWSTANLAAAKYGSAASCGVITPGVGMQVLSNLLDYTQSQYGFTQQGYEVVATYKAAYKYHACSFWHENPDAVAQVRQIGQQALDATLSPP